MKSIGFLLLTILFFSNIAMGNNCVQQTDKLVNAYEKHSIEHKIVEAKVLSKFQMEREQGQTRPWLVNLEGNRSVIFKSLKNNSPFNSPKAEVLAYKIAKELGIDNVPVTVFKEINEDIGSAQLVIKGVKEIHQSKTPYLKEEIENIRTLFDYLISNMDRHNGNILVDNRNNSYFIDQSMAFGGPSNGHFSTNNKDAVPSFVLIKKDLTSNFEALHTQSRYLFLKYYELGQSKRGQEVIEALKKLNEEKIKELAANYIDENQIKSLIYKRNNILKFYEDINNLEFTPPYKASFLRNEMISLYPGEQFF